MTQSVLDAIVDGLRQSALGAGGDQAPPAVVLWPDGERQWEAVVGAIAAHLPLLTLGDYQPNTRIGPAYWIRTALGGAVEDVDFGEETPVVYLPGVTRDEFRAAEDCPDALKPLVELQYRGVFWSQPNGKDWTPTAFLRNRDRGLNVEVVSDAATGEALVATLPELLEQPVEWLERKQPITAAVLNSLVQPDPMKTVLEWLSDPVATRAHLSAAEWGAFKASCSADYGFDPEKHGEIHAAGLLAGRSEEWKIVWLRFREAPSRYPGVEGQLRKAAPASSQGILAIDDSTSEFEYRDAWPQHNEQAENQLRNALAGLDKLNADQAREHVLELEKEHGVRRLWVWADLRKASLAQALYYLALLSKHIEAPPAGTVAVIADWYRTSGWMVDDAVLRALGSVSEMADIAAVEAAATALYADWLDQASRCFQEAVEADPSSYVSPSPVDCQAGTCLLFTDGLRYDLAVGLSERLRERGLTVDLGSHLAALPTITATAKPALAPIADQFGGGPGLAPTTEAGTDVGIAQLRAALTGSGYQVLDAADKGDPTKRAWTEYGNIDSHGHNVGSRLADAVESELVQIAGRVQMLLDAGWQQVEIVTDHGFLLLPGGLSKVELKKHLAEIPKGRCARLKDNQEVDQPVVSWRWDESVRVAVARGAACFASGKEYEHGGLSPQECVVPRLVVTAGVAIEQAVITKARWTGLRLRVEISGHAAALDLRTKPADAATSLLNEPAELKDGKAAAVVPEPEAEGSAAVVVLLAVDGTLLSQQSTIVGGM